MGAVELVESLYPNKSVRDVLLFEVPLDRATYLELELPASNYGCAGIIRFRIPKYMYDERAREQHQADLRRQIEEEQRREDARSRSAAEEARRREETRAAEAKRQEEARIKRSFAQNRAALNDPDVKSRIQAIIELGKLGPHAADAVPDLGKELEGTDRGVSKAAADALAKIGKRAVPILIDTLANGTQLARREVASALVSMNDATKEVAPVPDATVRKLKALFHDTDEAILLAAVLDVLAVVGGLERGMVDQLLTNKGLENADAAVRSKALNCLLRVGMDKLRIETLVKLSLADGSPEVRNQAYRVLGVRMEHLSEGDMKDVRLLLEMTSKPDAIQIGLVAVKRLGPKAKEALPELLKILSETDRKPKLEVAVLLVDIDAKSYKVAKAVSPILVAALHSETENDQSRESVLKSIKAIGQPVVEDIFKALEKVNDIGAVNADCRKKLYQALQQLGREAYSEGNLELIRHYLKKERYRDVQVEAGKALRAMLSP